MKFLIINHKTSNPVRFRATAWRDFSDFLVDLYVHGEENLWNIYVDHKLVSFEEAREIAKQCYEDFKAKRAETKKQVWARKQGTQGNFANNFHQIWVKK